MGTPMSVPLSSPAVLFPRALPCRMGNFSESLGRAQRTFAIYKCFVVSLVFAVLVGNAIFVIGICIFYFSPCRISTFGKNESTSSSVINPVRGGKVTLLSLIQRAMLNQKNKVQEHSFLLQIPCSPPPPLFIPDLISFVTLAPHTIMQSSLPLVTYGGHLPSSWAWQASRMR